MLFLDPVTRAVFRFGNYSILTTAGNRRLCRLYRIVYIGGVDKISGDGYKKWGDRADMPAIEEDIDVPVQELGSNDASEKEDKNLPKECVAFVVWPENPDQVYQYKVPDGNVEVGDSVVAPTYDAFNQKEVIRKARVVKVGYYEQADDGISTRKTVISVEKK